MIVEARGVTKHFGTRAAVDGIDLDVPAGECFGLLGPNGAGKTTTLRMLYGVCRPTAGTIRVFGIDIAAEPRAVRRRLGVTLQENVQVEALTPIENLRIFGRYHLLRGPALEHRIQELMDFLELRSHADVPVQRLSGGFKRRLAIAMSLINRPELLILDEPTTGLDPAVRLALWARIRDLRAAGKVIAQGAPATLIRANLAREAVEFDCTPEEEATLLDGVPPHHRLRSGRRLICYLDDATALVERLRRGDPDDRRDLVVRPANLEDVFLRLAGSTLEGGA